MGGGGMAHLCYNLWGAWSVKSTRRNATHSIQKPLNLKCIEKLTKIPLLC